MSTPEKPDGERTEEGLVCPECGCRDLRVSNTVPIWGQRIRRYRYCRHCGHRVVTTEKIIKA